MTSLSRRNYRRYALVGGAVAVTAGLAYHAYQADAYGRSKRYLYRLRNVLQKYVDALTTGADIFNCLLRDLQQFLQSDGNEVPATLRQLSKLIQSDEFTGSASNAVEAVYRGLSGSSSSSSHPSPDAQPQQPTIDKILDALLSDRGHSLVSVAVSMGAKNMVSAYVDATARAATGTDQGPDMTDKLFTFLSTPEGQQLAVMGVAAFASNGMRVYMDKSLDVNFYEDLFSSMSKPRHLEAVKQCVSVFARDVVGAYLNGGGNSAAGEPSSSIVATAPQVDNSIHEMNSVAVSGTPSPTGSADSGARSIELEAISLPGHLRVHDDLDSDSLLHARKSGGKKASEESGQRGGQASNRQWIAAVGREWVNVSKDPAGRQAMTEIVGSATREAVAAMSTTVADRFSAAWFLAVLVLGVVTAVLLQMMLRHLGAIVLHA